MSTGPRIVLFTGEGKGKTTAALGMALRASGHGMRALVLQFCKSDPSTGELEGAANLPGVDIEQLGVGWVPERSSPEFARHRRAAEEGLARAGRALESGRYDMVVLDEVCYAASRDLLDEQRIVEAVRKAPADCCVVLTGRGAPPGLVELADTVTEMRCLKHAFREGGGAQKGVEI